MKSKKILASLICVIFVAVLLCGAYFSFTIKQVKGSFAFTEKISAQSVQKTLDKFVGGNLLSFDTESVKQEIEKEPYLKVISVEKAYPNVVNVSVVERREVYLIDHGESTYILDETGHVLSTLTDERKNSPEFNYRDFITLSLNGINVLGDVVIGESIKTSSPLVLSKAFELAEYSRLTDCISGMKVSVTPLTKDVVFSTYTGVSIEIYDLLIDGDEKIELALSLYESEDSDFVKSNGKLIVYSDVNSSVKAVWTKEQG